VAVLVCSVGHWRFGISSVVDNSRGRAQATRLAGGVSQTDELQAAFAGSPESGSRPLAWSAGAIMIAATKNKNAVVGT